MRKELTPREKAVLDFIARSVQTKGYPPSVREIGLAVGLKSSSTVHGYILRLEKKGYLRRDPTKPRALELCDERADILRRGVLVAPMLGRVAAGQPVLAVENIEYHLPLSTEFFGEGDYFLLTVKGDSMIDAGILPNDIVVIRQQSTADNGDIVVALLEDEATVKRIYKENGRIRLQPENKTMDPIIVDSVEILGKVIGLMRRYH
ncbi:transcriptional repressor LexA [Desulfurispora thermophila]|uniref:transcriptional repressor LexA n=1 Tax=Desulfurispora thermophila TaxID=265470 RepID=UPI00037C9D8B|nr:transcriptional repressor LexA [Desulfurispora thermophila]